MHLELLVSVLLNAAICALLAALAALLLRMRLSVLAYLGAGLLGQGLGTWLAAATGAGGWPGSIQLGGATVHLLWTFVGALLVLVVAKLVRRGLP